MTTLDKRLAYWQNILSLGGWEIDIREAEPPHIDQDAGAMVAINSERMIASITIRSGLSEEEIDHGLVHELIHLWLDSWAVDGGLDNILKEQAINMIAKGLVTLYGRINRRSDSQYSVGAAIGGANSARSPKSGACKRRKAGAGTTGPRS